ncbi:YncE family protein, partial [Pseudoxanthomonas sp. SGD-10]
MTHTLGRISYALIISLGLFSCRKDNGVAPEEVIPLDTQKVTTVNGLYVLNEGNWGSNKASLDYYDYGTGNYRRNIYGEANPEVTLGLGDVGNDIKIYGSRLYIVVNASNKVEVLDVKTAKRIGKIDIPNCRYVSFYKGNAYVSSYEGYVSVIDTASITETAKITVGRQP